MTTQTSTTTGSRKIDRIVDEARDLGLQVTVTVEDEDWILGGTYRVVRAEIRRQTVAEKNMLDVANNSEVIVVGWSWVRTRGATPKMYSARKYGYLVDSRTLTASTLPYAIRMMADV